MGHHNLRLPLNWPELLTMREYCALADCYLERRRQEDFFHARTATSMVGGRAESIMVFKTPKKLIVGPDGQALDGPDFWAIAALMGAEKKAD
jgi:hypothetical protein